MEALQCAQEGHWWAFALILARELGDQVCLGFLILTWFSVTNGPVISFWLSRAETVSDEHVFFQMSELDNMYR